MKRTITLIVMLCIIGMANIAIAQEVKINTNLVVESDGTMRMDGAATVWDDIMIFPDATSKGGSYAPTWTKFKDNGSGSQGVFLWMFSPSTEQEVYFTVQIPHGYKVGSDLYPHVHWTTTSIAPTRTNVVWGLEYTVVKIGGNFSNTTILNANSVISGITTISGVGQHLITSFGAMSGTNLDISTILVCRLFRKAVDASDTYTDPVGLLGFDIHYEKDTQGSRTEFTK